MIGRVMSCLLLRGVLISDLRQDGTPRLCPATGESVFARRKIDTENGAQRLDFPNLLIQFPDFPFEQLLNPMTFFYVVTTPEQITNLCQGEAEGLRAFDKRQLVEGLRPIQAIACLRPLRFR
jgi:hypothetical protein